jgi:hypothetical protein
VYELLYLVEKKFWSIFAQQGKPLPLPKKELKFFSQPGMTIYTSHELLIRLWRIQKNYSFLVRVDLLELFEFQDVPLNLSMKKSKTRFFP